METGLLDTSYISKTDGNLKGLQFSVEDREQDDFLLNVNMVDVWWNWKAVKNKFSIIT